MRGSGATVSWGDDAEESGKLIYVDKTKPNPNNPVIQLRPKGLNKTNGQRTIEVLENFVPGVAAGKGILNWLRSPEGTYNQNSYNNRDIDSWNLYQRFLGL